MGLASPNKLTISISACLKLLLVVATLVIFIILLCFKQSLWDLNAWSSHPHPTKSWRPPAKKVVIAVGTLGGRISYLHRSLPTLMSQTVGSDNIILSICKAKRHEVVEKLSEFGPFTSAGNSSHGVAMKGSNGLTLYFLYAEDWGPGTKLVGAYLLVGSDPHAVIVTLDDDVEYQPGLVEWLVQHIPQPAGAVSGYCEEPLPSTPGKWRQLHENLLYRNLYWGQAVQCNGWLMGWGGVAYPASAFKDDLLTYLSGLPKGCFYHDDVWLSGYLYKAGVPRYVLFGAPVPKYEDHIERHPTLSISSIANTQELHQWPCAQHFNLFKPTAQFSSTE
ncbi:hypothetical protein CEUSTIGMA_g5728.t1 [Chlamydomonas eustigma]|uniref:Hexosyltransferase n=1 Tax=Chlamydomonas eustigma TaxID=1157962 RepID=A0A250X5G5_9CHLO|nr:hypothetical protein CEUSTIGMA_g5728.t1 [Chlamydomonas eustigma]|eukprot:GAX78286.1 hypothetical protein CEUSTIGMA_g5728.t1 [Chlamydomonas eustigma]